MQAKFSISYIISKLPLKLNNICPLVPSLCAGLKLENFFWKMGRFLHSHGNHPRVGIALVKASRVGCLIGVVTHIRA